MGRQAAQAMILQKRNETLVLWPPPFIAWTVSRLQHKAGEPKQGLEASSVEETEFRTREAKTPRIRHAEYWRGKINTREHQKSAAESPWVLA